MARADDTPIDVRVTETAVFAYHFDNRNGTRADDHYGEWLNRLNVQATRGSFTAAMRLDSAVFALRPDPNVIAAKDADGMGLSGPARDGFVDARTFAYGRDLSTRFRNEAYPSKVFVTYTDGGLSATAGDAYAQLGRGLVLSMRKVDELGVDTTVRGAKVDYKGELGDLLVAATGLAGLTNPLRVDEASGRVLSMASSGRGAYFPLMPHPHAVDPYLAVATPTFSPDMVVGGRVEAGASWLMAAVNAAQFNRDPSPSATPFASGADAVVTRNARRISIASASLSAPKIADHGSVYVEVATQSLGDAVPRRDADPTTGLVSAPGADRALLDRLGGGSAIYTHLSVYDGPVTVSFEGKRYERFFPVAASVDPNAVEFGALQYNAPPTTEPVTSDAQLGAFNACVTGGRARIDWRATDGVIAFGSVGRYVTYGERSPTCGRAELIGVDGKPTVPGETRAIRNDVWDPIAGFEVTGEAGRSHAYASTGVRVDDTPDATDYVGVQGTHVFYREAWWRYDLLKRIDGPFSVELSGWHRYRYEPATNVSAWREGEHYTSLLWAPRLTTSLGYEYSTRDGSLKSYVNGAAQWRVSSDTIVRLFAGQTRPALRCMAGVCRQFPAFEGAKLEIVARF